jgi:hypothetical protein
MFSLCFSWPVALSRTKGELAIGAVDPGTLLASLVLNFAPTDYAVMNLK